MQSSAEPINLKPESTVPQKPNSQAHRPSESMKLPKKAVLVKVRVPPATWMSIAEGLPFHGVLFAVPLDSLNRVSQTAVNCAQLHRGRLPQITNTVSVRAELATPALASCRKGLTQLCLGEALFAVHGMHVPRNRDCVVPWLLHRAPSFYCVALWLPNCLPGTSSPLGVTVNRPGR